MVSRNSASGGMFSVRDFELDIDEKMSCMSLDASCGRRKRRKFSINISQEKAEASTGKDEPMSVKKGGLSLQML